MKKQRISWVLALQALLLFALGLVFEQQLERHLLEQHEQTSAQLLVLISNNVSASDPLTYTQQAITLGRQINARVTLLDSDGNVLGDSAHPSTGSFSSLLDRPEIQQAQQGKVGHSARWSENLKKDLHYMAVRSQDGQLMVRIAHEAEHYHALIHNLRVLMGVLGVLLLSAVGGLWFYSLHFATQSIQQEKKRLEQELGGHQQELATLQSVAEMLGACITLQEVGDVIEGYFNQLLGQHCGMLAVMRKTRDKLEPAVYWGREESFGHSFSPNDCWALRLGRTHLDVGGTSSQHCAHAPSTGKVHSLCIPLAARGDILGSLNLDLPLCWQADPKRLAFCESIAKQVSLALANIQLNESLRQQATRDALTGLYNRRFMGEALEAEINRARRHNSELSILMLDLDHFKNINDRFGHESGDKALAAFARMLHSNCRREDIPCRYGGEEFCVLLPETGSQNAKIVAEKIRKATTEIDLSSPTGEPISITLSVGVASWQEDICSNETLLNAADEALYQAKASGRNRVVLASEIADNDDFGSF